MSKYEAFYEKLFISNIALYSSIRERIKKRVERVIDNPYNNTELLADASGKLNLIGCRSAKIDRNFRILFVICEECRKFAECRFCLCQDFPDKTVVFLTVGPHDKAYAMK
ncbi:MAG: hypothetical protein HQK63_15200 [Desulfamplus sp.]|nr:hypothetical protein [Desulfamplus sp.]